MQKQKVISFRREKDEPWIQTGDLMSFLFDVEESDLPVVIATYDDTTPYVILDAGKVEDLKIRMVNDKNEYVRDVQTNALVLYPKR